MPIQKIDTRDPKLLDELEEVWFRSVKSTHLFLSDGEITNIQKMIPQVLSGIKNLIIAKDEQGRVLGFIGVENHKIEFLFINPSEQGKGLGREFIKYGIKNHSVSEADVNEQNPKALGFYEHMGFKVISKSELDEQGNLYYLAHEKIASHTPNLSYLISKSSCLFKIKPLS